MNVLILGGNGYIGGKIARQLVYDGCQVVCTKRASSDISRLDDLYGQIKWIPASVDGVETALQYMEFDYVLNMVCNYGRDNTSLNSVIEANIEFPLNILNLAIEHGIKRFLTLGTGLPWDFNIYSFSKKIYSEFGEYYADKKGISFVCLITEMFYGADEPSNRFIPSIILKMIKGETVETTSGTQHRDIIAVEDIIKAIKIIMDSDLPGYNEIPVGTGVAPSISEIIDYIWMQTGKKSKIVKGAVPLRDNEPDCVADIKRISSLGKWEPVSWQEGLGRMIRQMELSYKS